MADTWNQHASCAVERSPHFVGSMLGHKGFLLPHRDQCRNMPLLREFDLRHFLAKVYDSFRLDLAHVRKQQAAILLWDMILLQEILSQSLMAEQMQDLLIEPVQGVKKRGQVSCSPTDQQMV